MNGIWVLIVVAYIAGGNGGRALQVQQMRFNTEVACNETKAFLLESFKQVNKDIYGIAGYTAMCTDDMVGMMPNPNEVK